MSEIDRQKTCERCGCDIKPDAFQGLCDACNEYLRQHYGFTTIKWVGDKDKH